MKKPSLSTLSLVLAALALAACSAASTRPRTSSTSSAAIHSEPDIHGPTKPTVDRSAEVDR